MRIEPISSYVAAKTLCHHANWNLTNLQIQKMLYIIHMIFLGKHNGISLIQENFEAWDYGPVIPNLYQKLRSFGSDKVEDVFREKTLNDVNDARNNFLKNGAQELSGQRVGFLVSYTHRENGAWGKYYSPHTKLIIPTEAILDEYNLFENNK